MLISIEPSKSFTTYYERNLTDSVTGKPTNMSYRNILQPKKVMNRPIPTIINPRSSEFAGK